MKHSNAPLLAVIGILMVMFVIPFVLAVITLIAYGEFALPSGLLVEGLLAEFDANFVLMLLVTALPALFVWLIESSRSRGDRRRSLTLTLVMLVVLVGAVTAVPFIASLRPLSAFPPGQALPILAVVALPLLAVMFIAAILLPEARRRHDGA